MYDLQDDEQFEPDLSFTNGELRWIMKRLIIGAMLGVVTGWAILEWMVG